MVYLIGQTGRCLNNRLREHRESVSAVAAAGDVVEHCRGCTCTAQSHCTRVLRQLRGQSDRKCFKAFCIGLAGDGCVSAASLALSNKQCAYLEKKNVRMELFGWIRHE